MLMGVHLIVSGRVQGVSFRAGVRDQALQYRLYGWAKNCTDGTVEIYAEGEREILDKLIRWCRKGTPLAQVSALDVEWVESQGLTTFEVY
jgi:acylphosphatase